MTSKTRTTIESKDITAIEIECNNCGAQVVRPLEKWLNSPPHMCGNCQSIWMPLQSHDQKHLEVLVNALKTTISMQSQNPGYTIRFDVSSSLVRKTPDV
jgi:uncharacterized Zn finger protein